jgi:mannose-1-phosphate guanylyltransferase
MASVTSRNRASAMPAGAESTSELTPATDRSGTPHGAIAHLYSVIMAGGSGTRFWPESRAQRPKQLLQLVGKRSMLQSTVDRLAGLIPAEQVLIVTNARLAKAVAEQLPELPTGAVLGEPCKRDTAPCIGLAAFEVLRHDPDAIMAVMPSDHVISTDSAFVEALRFATSLVEQSPERIVTFGIRPSYAAESFGYIERGAPLATAAGQPQAFAVRQFREKPKAEIARQYVETGAYYWNAGIFVFRAATILDALSRYEPELYAHLERIAAARDGADYAATLEREFSAIRGISIDYAVMERAADVVVVEAGFQWDDVGSWQSIGRLNVPDKSGNTIIGKHLGLDTHDSIVRTSDEHLVVTLGVKDCIVVHTPDATLVANRHDEESIRKLVKLIEENNWQEYL